MFKKSSIALAVSFLVAVASSVGAQQAATKSSTIIELQENAPDRYIVKRGDTLWGISTQFLKEPWRWPEFWRFNNEQIRNPHLIYPGQVLVLDRFSQRLALDDRVKPRVRTEPGANDAIPSIPANVIEPWLTRPLVIERDGLEKAPRIVAAEEGRYNLGAGGRAYVLGLPEATTEKLWQIYRPGRPLIDPDTKETLGIEAIFVGNARLIRMGRGEEPATIQIAASQIEVTPGDRLVSVNRSGLVSYAPHAPSADVQARIISIYGGRGDSSVLGDFNTTRSDNVADYDSRREAGPLQIVSINRGARDGLEVGHILAMHRSLVIKSQRSVGKYYMGGPKTADIQLPEERYGLVFVFRTFDRVAYGLIVQAQRTAVPGDVARTP